MERKEIEALRAPVLDVYAALAARVPNVLVWDPMETLCPGPGPCSAYLGDRPLFFDGDHLSGYGNKVLVPSFAAFMRKHGNAVSHHGSESP
jgi:hypothetical protein